MVVVCGEALIDLTPISCDGLAAYTPRVGGSPCNVAVTVARLGAPVGFLGKLSRDLFGRALLQHLVANGVDTRYLSLGAEPSALAFVDLDGTDEPEYRFYGDGTADRSLKPEELPAVLDAAVTALHFGSISLVRDPAASLFEALMRRESGARLVTLDPNVRPTLIGARGPYLARLKGWLELTDVVKISEADLGWLYPGADPEAVARSWLEAGPGLVVITRGRRGSMALTRTESVVVPAHPVTVVDTVGAGDAFMGGLIARWHQQGVLGSAQVAALDVDVIAESLRYAAITAALTCARSGADPPTGSAVDSVMG